MYVLSFLVVVLLVITCTQLGITVNDDKQTDETIAQISTSILDEHIQDHHRDDDPPGQHNSSDHSDSTPTTTAPIPTASPSEYAFPSMLPTTGDETSQPTMQTAASSDTVSPSAATAETSQPFGD
jgi:hypothetical protein